VRGHCDCHLLKQDGYNVAAVQNPTLSLEGDVAATRQVIDAQDGPVVLVGPSYGGAVITEAGTGPNVAALVTSRRSPRTPASR
jgi:pimeloyl-ACP methyl ester carboxylesterase